MDMELVIEYDVKGHNLWSVFVIVADLTDLHEMKYWLFVKLLDFNLLCRCTLNINDYNCSLAEIFKAL